MGLLYRTEVDATCDNCGKTETTDATVSGSSPYPEGWLPYAVPNETQSLVFCGRPCLVAHLTVEDEAEAVQTGG